MPLAPPPEPADDPLAPRYADARRRFLNAAGRLSAPTEHFVHPTSGPDGDEVALDTAWLGPVDAASVLLVVSGTHGVEGFAGSWCQSRWLEQRPSLPDDLAVLLVHAFNPQGFARVRRVNEDNVDLNRNFVDFADPPVHEAYAEIHEVICPTEWTEASRKALGEALLAYAETHGAAATQEAISAGQWQYPDGLYFGGTEPTWSHRMMRVLWTTKLNAAQRVAVIDLHTGLGPPGYGELITHELPDDETYGRLCEWYGAENVRSDQAGESVSSPLVGEWLPAAARWVSAEVSGVTIEWGTVDTLEVGLALMADNWLHLHGDPRSEEGAEITRSLRAAFAPDAPDWRAKVWDRYLEIVEKALTGVTAH